jgi:FkbM family methyltransferase
VRVQCHEIHTQTRSSIQRLGSELVRRIPASILARFGALLADVRPLGWYAGWKFGVGESDAGRLRRLRFSLWKIFEERRLKKPFTIRWYDGLRINMYLGNDLSRGLYVGGTYEPNEFMFLSQVLRAGMTFIDVGANDGLYTLFAAKRVGPSGRVVALEPSGREFVRLERNLRLNRLANICPLRLAASDREGVATLRIAGFGHEGCNTLGGFAYAIEQEGTEEVRLTTLDNIVNEQALTRVDVVKIDAEGGELRVLKGAHTILTTYRPLILLELVEAALVHQGASREAVLSFLQEVGYRFWIFGPSGRPEAVPDVDLDGVNIIAAYREYGGILPRISC